jgi:RNA polymerase sigma-70 factor, ECF subfamily
MQKNINKMKDAELYEMLRGNKKVARQAFDELYLRHSQKVYTFCLKYLNDTILAEDIFQETFTRLYTSSQSGAAVGSIAGFLITVAKNLCYNEANRKKESITFPDEYDAGYIDNSLENKELGNIIQLAIDTLPDHLKEVIILRENLDMSYTEIAEAMNISLSSVRVSIYRAKEKLRQILTPYLNDIEDK